MGKINKSQQKIANSKDEARIIFNPIPLSSLLVYGTRIAATKKKTNDNSAILHLMFSK